MYQPVKIPAPFQDRPKKITFSPDIIPTESQQKHTPSSAKTTLSPITALFLLHFFFTKKGDE